MTFEERKDFVETIGMMIITLGLITPHLIDTWDDGHPEVLRYTEEIEDNGMKLFSKEESYMWAFICKTMKVNGGSSSGSCLKDFEKDFNK